MSTIQILPESVVNKIAAGEVVERPASIVKELVENSIDAGADQIFVTIKNGGKDYISVLDNGNGMDEEDAKIAIERHATSKIVTIDDLNNIRTMGFRGEALAAIAAVSRFELTTCTDNNSSGFQIRMEGSQLLHTIRMGFPKGTKIVVEDLFFNTPARKKFLKATNTEFNHIHDLIIRTAIGHPHIQFRLTHNKKNILSFPKNQSFDERIKSCLGPDIAEGLIHFNHDESYLSVTGLISTPENCQNSKRWQHIFVNKRYVKCRAITNSVYHGYQTIIMKNKHPVFILNVNLSPQETDVNVHPAKTEIRLRNPNLIHTILSQSVAQYIKQEKREHLNFQTDTTKPININDSSETIPVQLIHQNNEQLGFIETEKTTPVIQKQTKSHSPIQQVEMDQNKPDSGIEANTPEVVKTNQKDIIQQSSNLHVIGQAFNKFIIAHNQESLVLIDQHAAHERILFEQIRNDFYNQNLTTHTLLIPLVVEFAPHDSILLDQHLDEWEKLGFKIDHFGGNDYSIKEIPAILKESNIELIIKDVLSEIAQFGKSHKFEIFLDEVFEKMACHSAIKSSQTLADEEMNRLIQQLDEYNIQLYCPHGRPIMIEFDQQELDKRFKRRP